MKARNLKPGDVIDPGAGMQPYTVARIERTKGSSKHGFLYVVRTDGTMNTYMNDTEVEVMIKDYEHYYRIAWTGPKFPPVQINFQRYATLAEANRALATWLEDPPGGFKTWGVVEHPATKFFTVGELKQALADIPDETPVYMEGSEWPMSWSGETETYNESKYEPDGILLKC